MWQTKSENFVVAVYPEMDEALQWAADQDVAITKEMVDGHFGPLAVDRHIPNIEEVSHQFHAAFLLLADGEPFAIAQNSGRGNGLEAWRRLLRRHRPSTGWRARSMPRSVLNPGRCRFSELHAMLEKWGAGETLLPHSR